jgi:hypothetical protein
MGTFLGIISALAALAGVASSVYGGVEQDKAAKKGEAYAKKQQKFSEEQMKRENAWARRGAMERALKGDPSKAFEQQMGPRKPDPYNPAVANTISGVAGGVQDLAQYDWSTMVPKAKPASTVTPIVGAK